MEKESIYTYKELKNGDIGYSFKSKSITEPLVSAYAALPLLVFGLYLIVLKYFNSPWMLLGLVAPISVFFVTYKRMNVGSVNRKLEEKGILDYFTCDRITELCKPTYGVDIVCLNRKYILRQTKELGNFERILVAFLSDGSVVKFRVVQRKGSGEIWNLTFRVNPIQTEERDLINSVIPLKEWFARLLNPDRHPLLALMLFSMIWLGAMACIVIPMILNVRVFSLFVFGYLILQLVLLGLAKYIPYPQWLVTAINIPGKIVSIALNLSVPVVVFMVGVLVTLLLGAIGAGVVYGISWLATSGNLGFNMEYATFLYVAMFSITSVYANSWIHAIFERLEVFKSMMDKSLESPILGFVEYLYQKENINFMIYIAYLVFIASSAINLYVNNGNYLVSAGVDAAVTKAFLVHIAFTNMVAKKKEMKLKVNGVAEYIIKMLSAK